MELRCSRDLARWLGAIEPQSLEEFKELKKAGHMLVRVSYPPPAVMFWPWAGEMIAALWREK